jgi:hypothetical protein
MGNKEQKDSKTPIELNVKLMSDDELFEQLKCLVNQSRFNGFYNKKLAVAVGKECNARKWFLNKRKQM